MSFAVFADGSANLPHSMLEGITLLPCHYTMDGAKLAAAGADAKEAARVLCQHEPFSGAHVGPGMLALFFRGKER